MMYGIEMKIASISVSLKGIRNGEATSIAIMLVPSGMCASSGSATQV
jgi:hypothetical protein